MVPTLDYDREHAPRFASWRIVFYSGAIGSTSVAASIALTWWTMRTFQSWEGSSFLDRLPNTSYYWRCVVEVPFFLLTAVSAMAWLGAVRWCRQSDRLMVALVMGAIHLCLWLVGAYWIVVLADNAFP